eukprot:1162132-Pelagomonas_calceolata.AAC.2
MLLKLVSECPWGHSFPLVQLDMEVIASPQSILQREILIPATCCQHAAQGGKFTVLQSVLLSSRLQFQVVQVQCISAQRLRIGSKTTSEKACSAPEAEVQSTFAEPRWLHLLPFHPQAVHDTLLSNNLGCARHSIWAVHDTYPDALPGLCTTPMQDAEFSASLAMDQQRSEQARAEEVAKEHALQRWERRCVCVSGMVGGFFKSEEMRL